MTAVLFVPCREGNPGVMTYRYAVDQLAVAPEQVLLVAVHPWDIDGARRAELGGAWLRRGATAYPATMTEPTTVAEDLVELTAVLTRARS